MREEVVVESRYRGPPRSGNGGYVSGLLAGHVAGRPEITLRRPIPLDTPLIVERDGEGGALLICGDELIAEGRPSDGVPLTPPPAPSWAEVEAAERARVDKPDSDFRRCFVCGCDREEGDGLRVLAAPVGRDALFTAPWTPHAHFAGEDGAVAPIYVWSALDCPGALACSQEEAEMMLLGRYRVDLMGPVTPGEPHMVVAWPAGREGRKIWAGTALFTADGEEKARAWATWITVPV